MMMKEEEEEKEEEEKEEEEEKWEVVEVKRVGEEGERINRNGLQRKKSLTFLHALTIFFKSYSEESPCTVVKVLRPFRCWILICTRPSWTSSSEPLIASAKGSATRRNHIS